MSRFLVTAAAGALLSGAAFAADLPVYEPAPVIAPVPVGFTWSGFYVGLHAGAVWGGRDSDDFSCDSINNLIGDQDPFGSKSTDSDFNPGLSPECEDGYNADEGSPTYDIGTFPYFELDDDFVLLTDADSDDGDDLSWLAGAQIGINQQYGRLVLGLEADWSWLFGGGDGETTASFEYFDDAVINGLRTPLIRFSGTGTASFESELDWLATFRGRIGGAFGSEGRLLVYGTGGLALAGVDSSVSGTFDEHPFSPWGCDTEGVTCSFVSDDDDDDFEVGFAIGAGAEYAFTNHLSVGLEYMFVGFDSDDSQSITFLADDGRRFDINGGGGVDDLHVVRVKLNWLFGPGSS